MAHRTRRFATTIVVNILLVVSLVFLGAVSGAAAQAPSAAQAPVGASGEGAIADAVQWLQDQQAADGSFGGSVGNTAEVALAAAAAGQDLSMWRASGGRTILDYLTAQADGYAVDAATTGKLVTALAAAGLDPRQTGDVDLVARLRGYDDGEGVFSTTALAQAWGILGLAAAESPVPQGAADALIAFQQADGGWEGGPGWGTDSNTTALAVQALVAAGVPADAAALSKAREYLRAQLAPAGGFVYSAAFGDVADANSTAYGIQGLLALGEDPASASWAQSDRTPRDALLTFQIADGAFEWQAGEGASLLATAQAVPALARATYPLRAPEEAEPAPVALQDGQAASNTLVGRRAGAQALYRLAHPGGGREVTIEVRTPAMHPLTLIGFGFNVYDASGSRLGGGAVESTSPEHVLRFSGASNAAAVWTVQVYSYIDGTPFAYTIRAAGIDTEEGAPTPATEPTANAAATVEPAVDEPDAAPMPDDEAAGTLVGDRGGAYARYRLVVGAGEDVALRLRFSPDDPATSAGLGFTIYTPSGRAIAAVPTGTPGEREARIAAASAGEYLVQVHNYLAGVTMRYELSR